MKTVKILPECLENKCSNLKQALFVNDLVVVLNKHNIPYSYSEGEIEYVTQDKLATNVVNSYPNGIASSLLDKQKLQQTLKPFGFNTLNTELITNPDSIFLTNFIVKFKESSGSSVISYGKNWFGGVLFTDKEAFKRHPLFADMFVPGKYIAQQAVSNVRNHTAVSIPGTVNSNGEVYFVRSSTDTWINSVRTKAVLSYQGYDEQKQQIQSFVKAVGIKNAVLMLQFVEQDGILYPIDWNFRLGVNIPTQMITRNFVEYETAILHMVGDVPTPPASYTDTWVVEF